MDDNAKPKPDDDINSDPDDNSKPDGNDYVEDDIWSEYDELYGEDFVDYFKPFGEDGKKILEQYGDDLLDVFDNLSDADIKKAIELANEYGDEAVELLKKGWSVEDSGISIKPESSPFNTLEVNGSNEINGEGAWLRDVDTEYKILSDIQSKLGDNYSATGNIKLYTELEPYPSCQSVIDQFKEMYPNIEIEVIYSVEK